MAIPREIAAYSPTSAERMALANKLPVMTALLDLDGRVLFLNVAYLEWLGLPLEDVVGKRLREILPLSDEEVQVRLNRNRKVAATGIDADFESVFAHPATGEARTLVHRVSPHESGQAVYVFVTDVTEQRLSLANEAKYRALVDTAGEGVIVINSLVEIQSFNKAAETLFGYEAEEVIGKNLKMLMPQYYAENHDENVQRYVRTRDPHIVGMGGVEAQGLRKDGSIFPAELAVAEFEVNGELFFTGIVRDLTDRKKYEKQLQEINDNLESELLKRGRALDQIFNLTDDILGIMDFDGMFVEVSPSARAITGVPSGYARENNIPYYTFAIEEDRPKLIEVFNRVVAGESVQGCEFRIRHVDGTVRWTSWNFRPVMEDRLVLLVGRDVTPEKIREEAFRQSQKMEAIGQLTGGIAHDFNNLLMGIMGSLDIIERRLPDAIKQGISRYIEGAQSSAKRAAALTHRLLAFSRRQPLAPVAVNINTLVENMKTLIQRTIGTEIEVIDQLDETAWATLCDPNQLEGALLNLMLNARDAMEGSAGTILIKTRNITPKDCAVRGIPAGEYVKIAVQDNGCSMDEATKQRAFDPFFTTKPIGQGTGLGLSMLYGFVNQTGGHVRIASTLGRGTTIMIYLPRTLVKALPDRKEEIVVRNTSGKGMTVVLVEDEAVVRELIVDVLEGVGYTVSAHAEGNSALSAFSDSEYDLLITDVGLPGLSGMHVAEMAREMQPDLKVLFITGYAKGITLREDLLANGDDMLLKPFTMEKLLTKTADLIHAQSVAA